MTVPAPLPRGRHRRASPGSARLSRSRWRHLQQSLTAGLLAAATVAGVAVGLAGAAVSPVAPAPPATVTVAMPVDPPGVPHIQGHHR